MKTITIGVLLLVSVGVGYYLFFKRWRINVYKHLADDFGFTYNEHKLTLKTLVNADVAPYVVREAVGNFNGKKVVVKDILAGMLGIINPFFQVTILEINGEKQAVVAGFAQWTILPVNSGLVLSYHAIANAIKSRT